jgi:hypothetical protein
MEVAAFDARGKMIMSPRQGSYESIYQENYIAWIGPIIRRQYHQKGRNLMVDFSDIN